MALLCRFPLRSGRHFIWTGKAVRTPMEAGKSSAAADTAKTGAGAVLGASVVCVDLTQENFV